MNNKTVIIIRKSKEGSKTGIKLQKGLRNYITIYAYNGDGYLINDVDIKELSPEEEFLYSLEEPLMIYKNSLELMLRVMNNHSLFSIQINDEQSSTEILDIFEREL